VANVLGMSSGPCPHFSILACAVCSMPLFDSGMDDADDPDGLRSTGERLTHE
jgi:hypothetical protein